MIRRFIAALLAGTWLASAWVVLAHSAEQFPLKPDISPIPVKVGGQTLMMLIDTGSTLTVLDSRHRSLLGEETASDFLADKPESDLTLYRLREVNVGAIKASLSKVACLPLGDPFKGSGVDGLLGMDFLKDYCIEFDWENKKATLHEEAVDFRDALAVVPISINSMEVPVVVGKLGGREVRFMIDTGDFSFVSLSPGDQVFALRGELGKTADRATWGVSGRTDGKITRLPAFEIGGVRWHDTLCDVDCPNIMRSRVGMRLIETYHTVIDLPRHRLIFVRANEKADPADINMSGMTVLRLDNKAVVYRIEDAGPAGAAHIEKGDVVLEIDGSDCSSVDIGQLRRRLRAGDGEHVRLKIRHGSAEREVDLVLRRRI
jgi:hypothetical protein